MGRGKSGSIADGANIPGCGTFDDCLCIRVHGPSGECAVETIERKGGKGFDDGSNRSRAERDVVGIAVHERYPVSGRTDLRLIACQQYALAGAAGRPMKHLEAVEMTAGMNQR